MCKELFHDWLEDSRFKGHPLTWSALIEALRDVEKDTLASYLEEVLSP